MCLCSFIFVNYNNPGCYVMIIFDVFFPRLAFIIQEGA